MLVADLRLDARPVPGEVRAYTVDVGAIAWRDCARRVREGGGRLVALWGGDRRDLGEGFEVRASYELSDALLCVRHAMPAESPRYPGVEAWFPAAARMQRTVRDLVGIAVLDAQDSRPWLRHGAWPEDQHPLRRDVLPQSSFEPHADRYPFVTVAGDGVHEIPVGPVHAGTIEPGNFRFSVLGERVLRLEERLGYKHKGIEKRFESLTLAEGARLCGRVSGDSTVAYSWAYCMALEAAANCAVPARAAWLRALALELERIANHLGDLGFIGNDAGVAFGLAQFSLLKEDLLRANAAWAGHRYLMDYVVPGGVARDLPPAGSDLLVRQLDRLEPELVRLREIYGEHAGLQDRLQGTGRVSPKTADEMGLVGLAGRASGQPHDLRVRHATAPYDTLRVNLVLRQEGDVAARTAVRFDEALESLRLARTLLERLPEGPMAAECGAAAAGSTGVGWIEGWRGEVFVFLECGEDGKVRACHPHDPSWQNWPLLELAVLGNIVPDFPLINKSFNLSYAGVDL